MSRFQIISAVAMLLGLPGLAQASNYGYSLNVDFANNGQAIDGPAGFFSERTWNGFPQITSPNPVRLVTDQFGQQGQVAARLSWQARSLEILTDVKPANENDGRLMRGFLNSPEIVLTNLDQVLPDGAGPLNYALILYTHGGRPGAQGTYTVAGRQQQRSDNARFDGKFVPGVGGNMIIFEDLNFPDLVITTDGFAPVNAFSVMYCRSGDFNGDGQVDVQDLEGLNGAVKDGGGGPQYDVNIDLQVDYNDVLAWIKWSKGTCIGDVNLDGAFDSSDLIQLFQKGTYETGELATWTSGDWNGDCKFDSSDLLVAFQEGCYEGGAIRVEDAELPDAEDALNSVPEPLGLHLLLIGLGGLIGRSRRRLR